MKLNKKHTIITIIPIMICLIGIYLLLPKTKKLELNGKEKQIMMIHSIYEEQGTNIDQSTISGNVDTSKEGIYKIDYTYKNQKLTRTVEIKNDKQIVMNINGSENTYVKQNQKYIESGCHVIDQNEGNITDQVKIKGSVDTSKIGDYEIIYSVENKDGIVCSKKRTVHVISENDFKENLNGIPVLMYHYVYTNEDLPKQLNANYILNTKLEEQLQYLKEENYYFPSYQELSAYIKNEIDLPEKSIILTFDDGQNGFLKYGIPLLEKYKIPATSFIIASKNGEKKVKQYASEYISFQSHSYDMHKAGGNIGHGGIISTLDQEEIKNDLLKSQEIVQNVEAFAYPYGDITEEGKKAIHQVNILCSFTTQYGKVNKGDDITELKRIRVLGDNSLESFKNSIK